MKLIYCIQECSHADSNFQGFLDMLLQMNQKSELERVRAERDKYKRLCGH